MELGLGKGHSGSVRAAAVDKTVVLCPKAECLRVPVRLSKRDED